jgi:anti-anti-sigma regulatory factor
MNISSRLENQQLTIKLGQHIGHDEIIPFRKQYLDKLTGLSNICIDFEQTNTMNSAILGMLLNLKKATPANFPIKLVNCCPATLSLLEACRLTEQFSISSTRQTKPANSH